MLTKQGIFADTINCNIFMIILFRIYFLLKFYGMILCEQ